MEAWKECAQTGRGTCAHACVCQPGYIGGGACQLHRTLLYLPPPPAPERAHNVISAMSTHAQAHDYGWPGLSKPGLTVFASAPVGVGHLAEVSAVGALCSRAAGRRLVTLAGHADRRDAVVEPLTRRARWSCAQTGWTVTCMRMERVAHAQCAQSDQGSACKPWDALHLHMHTVTTPEPSPATQAVLSLLGSSVLLQTMHTAPSPPGDASMYLQGFGGAREQR